MKKLFLLLIILLIIPISFAKSGHMTLLAVSEKDGEEVGAIADLYLDIVPGQGRVYIDTFPLTKLDTQMSTRFAKQIACDFLDKNCNNYDFFYTIRAKSAIIGGPSASGAAAVLTVALLDDLKLDEKVAMTGTINSGGLIGPVGGIKAKIEAASKANITKVIIPEFSVDENSSELSVYGIEIINVSTLEEAMYEFTGKNYKKESTLVIDSDYVKIMRNIAEDLCDRAEVFSKNLKENNSMIEAANETLEKAKVLMSKKKYYSAASYCFTSNIKYNYQTNINITEEELLEMIEKTESEINNFNDIIDKREIRTLTDLQTFMIVKERIIAAQDNLNKSTDNKSSLSQRIYSLTFSVERLNSAKTWSRFFDTGKRDTIEKEKLKNSCINKIAEAEERLQYVSLYISGGLTETRKELNYAHDDAENGDYDLCLFKASKAKADADLVLTTLRISANQTDELIEKKLELVKNIIARNDDFFPIIGYSYYEYAGVLKEEDPMSSLVFIEYSLELSNLDLYFTKETKSILNYIDISLIMIFAGGLLIGVVIGYFFRPKKRNKIRF